ncbi:hypothetical protein THAOC_07250 [Thalassiosira oceanica]|uniref:Plant heme peroxidase family profile domain-containing protein n=1 Tax=Thalassiosira oceanica TaxID=159749 RepID=K0T0T1_THAOC|nr:hypothetical protein THAOC_07250 [Thalassiosira oceanica]|eukprot:EJK71330.1 hypothetical protein THAOC_07250 [Thalassiosira oceanica]
MMNFSIALVTLLLPSAVSAQRQLRTERGKPSVDEKRPQPDKITSVVERPQPDKFTSTIDFDVEVKPIKPPIGFLRPTQRPTRKIDNQEANAVRAPVPGLKEQHKRPSLRFLPPALNFCTQMMKDCPRESHPIIASKSTPRPYFAHRFPAICEKPNPYAPGTCVYPGPTSSPTIAAITTDAPTTCLCASPGIVPDECELDILIDMMEMDVALNHNLAHSTKITTEGGANGCLMNFPPMRLEPENNFLNDPLNHLEAIKNNWHSHPDTCIDVSSADMLQFAMFFVVVRQSNLIEPLNLGTPNVIAKRNLLKTGFAWGRPDETQCDTMWVDNLPGFSPPNDGNIAGPNGRCAAAGGEIKTKMMDRNGFTAEEATVLIGAHTIGLVRNTFGSGSFAGPWVSDGADNATPDGPVFNNKYHDFLINTIVANDASQFAAPSPGIVPFTMQFGDWFRDVPNDLDHLDTDIALAFPSENLGMHPDFSVHSAAFAGNNAFFLSKFMAAMDKMGKLGVSVTLQPANAPCSCSSRRRLQEDNGFGKSFISLNDALALARDLGNATSWALMQNLDTQQGRIEEIQKLTTPEHVIGTPRDSKLFDGQS